MRGDGLLAHPEVDVGIGRARAGGQDRIEFELALQDPSAAAGVETVGIGRAVVPAHGAPEKSRTDNRFYLRRASLDAAHDFPNAGHGEAGSGREEVVIIRDSRPSTQLVFCM